MVNLFLIMFFAHIQVFLDEEEFALNDDDENPTAASSAAPAASSVAPAAVEVKTAAPVVEEVKVAAPATAVASDNTPAKASKIIASSSSSDSIPPGASPEYKLIKQKIERLERFGKEVSQEDRIKLRKAKFGLNPLAVAANPAKANKIDNKNSNNNNSNNNNKNGNNKNSLKTNANAKTQGKNGNKSGESRPQSAPSTNASSAMPAVSISKIIERKRKFGIEVSFDDMKKLRSERFNSK